MDRNMGTIEILLATAWARIKAECYAMFHLDTRVMIQSKWVEDRRAAQYSSEYLVTDDSHYREVIQFIGVVRGYEYDGTFQIMRGYYGDPVAEQRSEPML